MRPPTESEKLVTAAHPRAMITSHRDDTWIVWASDRWVREYGRGRTPGHAWRKAAKNLGLLNPVPLAPNPES